jgi:hypothetical protein
MGRASDLKQCSFHDKAFNETTIKKCESGNAMNATDSINTSNTIPNNLPPPVEGFTDRVDEFDHLDRLIRSKHRPHIVVWGEGGIGKTSLILAYVHTLLQSGGFDAAVWTSYKRNELGAPNVTFRNPYLMTIDDSHSKREQSIWVDSFDDFLLKVMEVSKHPNSHLFRSQPPTIREVVDWLCLKRVIVVVDDLDSWEDWKDYVNLAERVPSTSSVFIISSRQLFDLTKYQDLVSVKVGPIPLEHANDLLTFLMEDNQIRLSPYEQQHIIEFADGNPLLIRLSMVLIQNKLRQLTPRRFFGIPAALPIDQLLRCFSGESAEKFLIDDIYAALSPNAKKTVIALAVLNRVPSSRSVYNQLSQLVPLPTAELHRVLKELEASSLVNRKGNDQNPQDMHEVVRDLILQKDRSAAEEFTRQVTEMLER